MEELFLEDSHIIQLSELKPDLENFIKKEIGIVSSSFKILISPFSTKPYREAITYLIDENDEPVSFSLEVQKIKAVNLWLTYTQNGIISDFSSQKFFGRTLKNGNGNLFAALQNIRIRKNKAMHSAIKAIPVAKLISDFSALQSGFWAIQPKFDGLRMLVSWKDLGEPDFISRHGKILNPGLGIKEELKNRAFLAALNKPQIIFDGELCAHNDEGGFLSFQETASMVMCQNCSKEKLFYIIFDIYDLIHELPLMSRWQLMRSFFSGGKQVRISPGCIIKKIELKKMVDSTENHLSHLYESLVIKHTGIMQAGIKSKHFKYKFYKEIPVRVLNIFLSPKNKLLFSVRSLENTDEIAQTVIGGFSFEEEQQVFSHRKNFIGSTGRVRFCQKTSSGFLRSAVFYSLPIEEFLSEQFR